MNQRGEASWLRGLAPVSRQECASDEQEIGTAKLLTGLGIDEYFSRTDGDGRRTFLTDVLGSTIALTDDTGAIVTEYAYDSFGGTTASGSPNGNSFQYTGREHDGPTGLYYYRTRYYSPTLHRFISEDRLESDYKGTNLYSYVLNDPVGFIDPYGENPIAGAAGAAAMGAAAGAIFIVYADGGEALGNRLMALLNKIFEAMNAAAAKPTPGAPPPNPSPGNTPESTAGGSGSTPGSLGRPGNHPGILEFPGGQKGAEEAAKKIG